MQPRRDGSRPIPEFEVREHLDRLLASAGFRTTPRLQSFLRYVVEHSLAARDNEIKEASIGVEVYGKQPGYDPRVDSTVRVEASKLRQRLAAYYEDEGAGDPIRIQIPKGGYVARIERVAPPPVDPPPARPPSRLPYLAAALIALIGLGVAVWRFWPAIAYRGFDPGSLRITRLTTQGVLNIDPAVSPDGSFIVYASDFDSADSLDLWKLPLDRGPATRLTRSPFSHTTPTISRDGAIVYRTNEEGGTLAILDPGSSSPRILPTSARARDPRFAPVGSLLAYWVPGDEETGDYGSVFIQNVQDTSLIPVRVFGEFAHATRPIWHENATHLLAAGTWRPGVPEREFDLWMIPLSDIHPAAAPVKTGLFPLLASAGLYSTLSERRMIEVGAWSDGWLYITIPSGEAEDLYRVRLDAASGIVSGAPQRLTLGSGYVSAPRLAAGGLVFAETETSMDLYSVAEPAPGQPATDLRKHTAETGINIRHVVDPSGTGMAWEHRRPGSLDQIWYYPLAGGPGRQLGTALHTNVTHVLLAPDGHSAAYRLQIPAIQPIYRETIGSGQPVRICENCGMPSDWSPDGSHLWYVTGGQPARIGLLDVKSGKSGDSLTHPSYNLFGARQHVDSRGDGWLAFYADNGPRTRQIHIAAVRGYTPADADSWIPATTGANWDVSPAWSASGNVLYFVSRRDGHACIMAKSLDPVTKRPAGPAWAVRHFHEPGRTLMRSRSDRGADTLWVAGGRIYFMLDRTTSSLRRLTGLFR